MKHVTFEKMYRQTNIGMMNATVKKAGIILGHSRTMSIQEVKDWIKNQIERIEETKEDIKVAEKCIELYKKEFINEN